MCALTKLRCLDLTGNQQLAGGFLPILPGLQELALPGSCVRDLMALPFLQRCTSLQELLIGSPALSDASRVALQAALPLCCFNHWL